MSFKQYLNEFGDINKYNTNEIEIRPFNSSYYSGYESFFGEDNEFRVFFINYEIEIYGDPIVSKENSYDINFAKSNQYYLTHKGSPFMVYKELIRIVKAFVEKFNPDGLHISGFTPEMNLVYDRFYKSFMVSHYLRLDTTNFISRAHYETMSLDKKRIVDNIIKAEAPRHTQYLQAVRDSKKDIVRNFVKRSTNTSSNSLNTLSHDSGEESDFYLTDES